MSLRGFLTGLGLSPSSCWSALYYAGGGPCASLAECSGILKWVDDGTDFVFDPTFMEGIQMTVRTPTYLYLAYESSSPTADKVMVPSTANTVSPPKYGLCKIEPSSCRSGKQHKIYFEITITNRLQTCLGMPSY